MIRKILRSVIFFSIILFSFQLFAADLDFLNELSKAKSDLDLCLAALPTRLSAQIISPTNEKSNVSGSERKKVRECLERKRTVEDLESMIALSADLTSLGKIKNPEVKKESDEIAYIIVSATRELNKKYKMGRSSLFHNFLIKVGAREGGYCYQWAEAIYDKFPKKPYEYFERHWGVHKEATVLENNAIIITARGEPVSKGVIYDPWRGKGRPFWKFVSDDTQDWKELFTENQILTDQHK